MGIRYNAYRIEPYLIGLARQDPGLFLSGEPPTLDLDACWPSLQRLTTWGENPRPSHRLFEGDVLRRDGCSGWDPWMRVLAPDEVERIAADLVLLGERQVRAAFPPERVASVLDALDLAQHFAVGAARAGHGIIYTIG